MLPVSWWSLTATPAVPQRPCLPLSQRTAHSLTDHVCSGQAKHLHPLRTERRSMGDRAFRSAAAHCGPRSGCFKERLENVPFFRVAFIRMLFFVCVLLFSFVIYVQNGKINVATSVPFFNYNNITYGFLPMYKLLHTHSYGSYQILSDSAISCDGIMHCFWNKIMDAEVEN